MFDTQEVKMKKTISFILAAVMVLSMVLSLTGCGASLSDYTIITPDDGMERTYNAARELQKYIKSTTEETVRISTNVGDTETAIFVGQVDNDVVAAATKDEFVTPMDYVIKVVGKNIVVAGGSTFANAAAVDKMLSLLQSEEMQIKDGYEYEFHFLDTYELNPLVSNPDAFTAKWANEYTAPEWLYDQKEKIYAITHKDSGRLAVVSHRCDFVYYPEGTLEAVLSCILAGVDAIELDVHLTKDNIPVVRHDENLSRNTNFGSKAGKDGLPTSNMIGDWTYEQLQQLSVTMNNGAQTEYKIPTLYEVLLLAGQYGSLLTLDEKADEVTSPVFAATDSTCTLEEMQVYGEYTESLDNLIYYYRYWKGQGSRDIFMSVEGMSDEYYEMAEFWFDCEEDGGGINKIFTPWNDNRYKAWGYAGSGEKDHFWNLWYNEGYRVTWSNRAVPAIMYVAKTYGPADYSALVS